MLSYRLSVIVRTKEQRPYSALPPAVKRVAAENGVKVDKETYIVYRPDVECATQGYPDDANVDLVLGHAHGNFPGNALVVHAGRGESTNELGKVSFVRN